VSRDPGDGEGQGSGRRKRRTRPPRPSPSQLPPEEAYERAFSSALRLLSVRERSRAELRSKLAGKGFHPSIVIRVLDRLEEGDLQSDRRFAEGFTAESHRSRGLSAFAIQGELRRRGVEKELAAEASTEAPEDEEARARTIAVRRAARMGGLSPDAARRRLEGFLARRGFAPELCRRLARELALGAPPAGS